ncbi:HTH-type transcriptional regulator PgrR [Achromobacter anxifer]|uniref:LysR family transcriptional regulator n=1 Tax=Achromobacter anxifer TaxID=1287737 RepID=UPI00155B876E|nr:LysR family transcriptional regulator [Achromobacter anxifer]CAB5511124.1 HTH-type transcriptional regulator PgrR [Achromobacter anxifer]
MDFSRLPQLATFVQIASHRSFTKAAAELGISRTAVSHSLASLEKRLGVKLLQRTTRDMSLTDAGKLLVEQLRPALAAIDSALHNIHATQETPSGILKVNTSRSAAKYFIEPHMGEFLDRYPFLSIELIMDDGLANIVAESCDAGIRLGESLSPNVVAVPITEMMEMAVVASPEYLKQHGTPKTPADLATHNCISYRQTTSGLVFNWEFHELGDDGRAFTITPNGRLVTNDDECTIRAALQGRGVAQHIDYAVQQHVAQGTLVRILRSWSRPFPGFYLYTPSRDLLPQKVKVLKDFLIEKREERSSSQR